MPPCACSLSKSKNCGETTTKVYPIYSRALTALLLCILPLLASCVMLPIPTTESKVLAGKPVKEEQLSFLKPNITTKQDVIERLGSPNVIWEDVRVFAYNWDMRQGILFWAVGAYYSGGMGTMDIPKHYALLIQFDEQDRVQRFERRVRPSSQSYIDFLKEWVKTPSPQSPQNPPGQGE